LQACLLDLDLLIMHDDDDDDGDSRPFHSSSCCIMSPLSVLLSVFF
jgi:hypothetical protein